MSKNSLWAWGKRGLSTLLTTAMVMGMIPTTAMTAKAAENEPYIVSMGRMVYASSAQSNSDATLAVDGNESTRWESAWGNTEEWLYVDLGKVTEITSIRLSWEGAYATSYAIQFSDDEENWDTRYSTNECNGGVEALDISGNARYVRIYMNEKSLPAYGYSLYEFQVFGRNGLTERPVDYGENLAEGKTVSASSLRDVWWMYDENGVINQTAVLAENAVDGNSNTSWTSGEKDDQWFCVDLGQIYTIGRVIIDWSSDAGKIYDIQVSADGQTWDTVYRQLKGYAYEYANIELYTTGRYVRMYGYTRVENGSGFAIREMEVYAYQDGDEKVTYTIEPLPEMQVISSANGKGSYVTEAMYLAKAKLPTYLAEGLEVPIDSNDWWQSSLIKQFGNLMSILPLKAQYSTKGLSLLTATEGWLPAMGETDVNVSVVSETVPDLYILPENLDSLSAYDQVSGYSDYAVNIDLCDKNGVAMTTTFVKGSPYVFMEYGDTMSVFLSASSVKELFDENGNDPFAENTVFAADHIGIRVVDNDNRDKTETSENFYCVNVPEGTLFKKAGNHIKITFPAENGYMSIGTMTAKEDLNTFYQHGYAFVEDTSVTYRFEEATSEISVDYKVETKVKREGFASETMQCMLPHQWKKSADDADSIGVYTSVRGDLKAVASNCFTTTETFMGLLPTFAMPDSDTFDSARLLTYLYELENATKNLTPAADAYWEGKNLHPLGMGVLMADQIGATELRDVFLARIKTILVNWFHYDGPDDVSYFIYDENWGTLYYLQSEFGANTAICDHHFTYGYFMFAATVLATYDQQFYDDYKDMIEMLIRDYANPDEADEEYCRFRSYDLYEGHSWAGGYADNDSGNNQESASESLFSWVTLYLWGMLSGEDVYRDAGIFGFTNEMDAVKQYWFDYDLDNWIEEWPYEVVGQVYGGINFYGTFFGGQPLYIYGIQWLPISEYLTYYGMNRQRCADIYAALLADTEIAMEKAVTVAQREGKTEAEIQNMLDSYPQADTGWQHITWPFLAQTNPALALQKFEANASKVQKTDTANTYWFINSMLQLGYKSEDVIATGDACASVYYNEASDKYTAVIWNPTNESKTVTFFRQGEEIGRAVVGAKALVDFEITENQKFEVTQTQAPIISVPSGTYEDTQYVEIAVAEKGAVIYYTTDGTVPTRESKVYDGVFAVSGDTTVKAIAVKEGSIDSPMASSSIVIQGSSISYETNLATNKTVVVSSEENAGTAGSNLVDGMGDTRWASGFTDDEWFVVDLEESYAINKIMLDWEASYAIAYKLLVSEDNESWTPVYETTNGSGGTEEIVIDAVNARYVKMQGVSRALPYGYSLWEIGVYEAGKVETPSFGLASGTYSGAQTLSIQSATKGVEIRYTMDGTQPDETSMLYVPGVMISQSGTVKAIAYKKGMLASDVAEATYEIEQLPEENPFSDVKETDWFYPYAKFAYDRGMIGGKGYAEDGKVLFDPSGKMTRAEFVQVLYSKEGKPAVEYRDIFQDVKESDWFADAVIWANSEGIVAGSGDKFDVSGKITREQLALILYKYAIYKEFDTEEISDLTGFADSEKISEWALPGMQWAVAYGIIGGTTQNELLPKGNTIRAEAATMMRGFMVTYEGVEPLK